MKWVCAEEPARAWFACCLTARSKLLLGTGDQYYAFIVGVRSRCVNPPAHDPPPERREALLPLRAPEARAGAGVMHSSNEKLAALEAFRMVCVELEC
jgi:hypothetical protein